MAGGVLGAAKAQQDPGNPELHCSTRSLADTHLLVQGSPVCTDTGSRTLQPIGAFMSRKRRVYWQSVIQLARQAQRENKTNSSHQSVLQRH